jgi:uncharacterized OB-fold protein
MTMRVDIPTPDASTQPFWDGAAEGRLLISVCRKCGHKFFYPRPFCPSCWGEAVEWAEASGRASLYTWSVVFVNDLLPFADRLPYVAAIAELEEGPRLETNIVECDVDDLRVGLPLEVQFRTEKGLPAIPVFRPAA